MFLNSFRLLSSSFPTLNMIAGVWAKNSTEDIIVFLDSVVINL